MKNHIHNKDKKEVINNESHQREFKQTETQAMAQPGQLNKEAFILHQVFNKTDRPPESQMARLAPIVFAWVRTGLGKAQPKDMQVLLDSRASSSIISHKLVKNLQVKDSTTSTWAMAAGSISTNQKAKVQFMLPELSETKIITWKLHVLKRQLNMI